MRPAWGCAAASGDGWLRVGGVKMFADGALGSRTANMLQPYEGETGKWGVAATDPEEMLERSLLASEAGLALTIHAIGDRANRDVLNVLAEVRRREGHRALRHRIEHVQCIHDDDLPRLAQLDVIASVQPIHATADMRDRRPVLGATAGNRAPTHSAGCSIQARIWSLAPMVPSSRTIR